MRDADLTRLMEQGVRAWSGVALPNAAAAQALADMPHLVRELAAIRGLLRFEDEPSGFEAALAEEAEPAPAARPGAPPPRAAAAGALHELGLVEAAEAVARGEVTATELVRAALDRIGRAGALNAVVRLEAERGLRAAAAADAALRAGAPPGPLHGVPLMHKDMFYRAGEVSGCGSAIRRDFRPDTTATVLERLDAAGAIDLGTLNMAEFAQNPTGHNRHHGDCHNPWSLPHCTGGSSSGSGAAVAGRLVWGALGSDTGGSIRLPAAMCGVTGLKPTQTRVSRAGVMPLSFSCDNVGPLVRSARDAARLFGAIAGHDPRDPTSARRPVPDAEAALDGNIRGVAVTVVEEFLDSAAEEVVAPFEAALAVLAARGARIRRVSVPAMRAVHACNALLARAEAAAIHAEWMRHRAGDYAAHLSGRLHPGFAVPAHLYIEALSLRGPLLRRFCADAFEGAGALVATPTLRGPVPTLAETDVDADPVANWGRFMGCSVNTRPFNYLGLPVVSLPCGFDRAGLPVGLQLAGRPFGEAAVLRAADAFQRDTDWHRRLPPA
ncbi:amidase [Falsiroseomonas sp. CW058]|uniref:amidase n=1 Tax=Falsiroseomonas sp. CW058 TaxID=3388664 RepID=UPI003D31BE22